MFRKVTDRLYYRPNIGLILGDKYTLLFDAGNSADNVASLRAELAAQGLPEPDFVAVSHWHWDHTFGMYAWGVPTIAGRMTNEKLKIVQTWAWDDDSMKAREHSAEDIKFCNVMIAKEYPDRSHIRVSTADIVFDGRMTLDLGGITCELLHAALSNLKNLIRGTYHGRCTELQPYFDEFCFRFNRRMFAGQLFSRLTRAVATSGSVLS